MIGSCMDRFILSITGKGNRQPKTSGASGVVSRAGDRYLPADAPGGSAIDFAQRTRSLMQAWTVSAEHFVPRADPRPKLR